MTNSDICPFCKTIVKTHGKATCHDLCSYQIHVKCNNHHDLDQKYLKRMRLCASNPNKISLDNADIDPNLKNLLRQLNDISEKETNDNENLPNSKQRDTSYFSNLNIELK